MGRGGNRSRYAAGAADSDSDMDEPKTPTKKATSKSPFASLSAIASRTLRWRTRAAKDTDSDTDSDDDVIDKRTGEVKSKEDLARDRGEYIPPSVEEAMEYRDEEHPRIQGARGLEPYPLKIGIGDMGVEFGPGIALYFNFLQWMSALFFILFVLNIPTIMIAHAAKYYGPYSASRNSTGFQQMWDAEYDMASTTFGSIAPDDVQEGDWLKYTNEDVGLVLSLTKTDFLYGAAMADILGCILFLVMCVFFARRQRQIVRAVDEDSIEITDYSVMIKGLPEDATDKEEVRCFFELKFGKVVDAVLAKNDGVLLHYYKKRSALAMRHDVARSKFIKTGKGEKTIDKLEDKIAVVDDKIIKLKMKKNFKTKLAFVTFSDEESWVECLRASPRGWLARWMMRSETRFRGKFAYTVEEAPAPTDVMFENLDVPERSRYWRRKVISLVTVVLLLASFGALTVLSGLKTMLTSDTAMDDAKLALHIGGPGGGSFATAESVQLASEDPSLITLRPDFNATNDYHPICAPELSMCEVTYSEPGLLAIMPWGTALSVLPLANTMSQTEKDVKVKTIVKEMTDCGESLEGCSPNRVDEGVRERRRCHACYCAGRQYALKTTTTDRWSAGDLAIEYASDLEIATLREQCDDFLAAPSAMVSLLVTVTVIAVAVVNSLLKTVVKAISAYERPASLIEQQRKVSEKVFSTQFFNTAILSLAINAALPELLNGIPIVSRFILNGTHRDFDYLWYKKIGGPLLYTMCINSVGPIAGNLIAEVMGYVTRATGKYTKWTQRELNEAFTGPEFDIATRYGEVLMCIMVTMMYGSGMPLLYAFASFFCLAIGASDKRFLLRVCRRPPRYGTALAMLAIAVVPWAAFVHLLFGMWMHTHFLTPLITETAGVGAEYSDAALAATGGDAGNATESAFSNLLASGATLQDLLDIANNASAAARDAAATEYPPILGEISRRTMQTNGFPFFLLAILFVAIFAVVNVVSHFWKVLTTFLPCINALPCFREDADYEGVPTFEDAFMMDKLIGAHTYEMREMPMYKKFFFEGKGGFKERNAGRGDQSDPDTPFKNCLLYTSPSPRDRG